MPAKAITPAVGTRTAPTMPGYLAGVNVAYNADGDRHLAGLYSVHPLYVGVDRPDTGGWAVPGKLVDRLCAAVLAGATHTAVHPTTDVNGATYMAATSLVSGRHMNADLRRLGY